MWIGAVLSPSDVLFWLLAFSLWGGKQGQPWSGSFWEDVAVWGKRTDEIVSREVNEWMDLQPDCWAAQSSQRRLLVRNIKWDLAVKFAVSLPGLLAPCLPHSWSAPQWPGQHQAHSKDPTPLCHPFSLPSSHSFSTQLSQIAQKTTSFLCLHFHIWWLPTKLSKILASDHSVEALHSLASGYISASPTMLTFWYPHIRAGQNSYLEVPIMFPASTSGL